MYSKYLKALADILFPQRCFICNTAVKNSILCEECKEKIHFLRPPLCELCAKEMRDKSCICRECRAKKIYYDKIISCLTYREPVKTLIHLVKYRYYDYIVEFLSSFMVQYLSKISFPWENYDFITSVPSHPVRLREREYNQSNLLAKNLSNFLGIPLKSGIIFCKKNKPSQTIISNKLRIRNVENNFLVKNNLNNTNVIIVDDVITTGSTLSECAKALKEGGAHSVLALTLARA